MSELTFIDKFPSKRCFQQPLGKEVLALDTSMNTFLKLFEKGMSLRAKCPLCAHDNSRFGQLSVKDNKGIPCYMGECEKCGFVFSYKHLSEESLSENYRFFSTRIRGIDTSTLESRKQLFLKRAHSFALERFNFLKEYLHGKKTVVEIGCNDGANLYPFFKNGLSATGFDLDQDSLNVGIEFGLDLRGENCFPFLEKHKTDVVILSHFLEHLIDPLEFLKNLYTDLQDGSLIFVEVPGLKHPQWVNWKAGILPYFQYEHLQCFEKATLVAMMGKAGFECLKCDEFVRGVFVKGKKIVETDVKKTDGFRYLYEIEKTWETSPKRKIYSLLVKVRDKLAK